MKKILYSLFLCCFLTSCVTMFNGDYTKVFMYTEKPAKVVFKRDTIQSECKNGFNAVALDIPRSRDSLYLIILTDSSKRILNVPAKKTLAYYLDIPIFFPVFILDNSESQIISNSKYYGYKNPLVLDKDLVLTNKISSNLQKDMLERRKQLPNLNKKKYENYKGDLLLNLFFPHVNYFKLSPDYEDDKDYFGFMGIGLGVDYYYHKNRFLNISVSGTTEFMLPFPAPVCMEGEYTRAFSLDAILTNNHRINRISLGYGLSYARNIWRYNNDDIEIAYSRYNSALGLAFKGQFYFSEKFTVGLIYRPTFVRLNSLSNKTMKYEHLLSLDFGFKFRLNKRK